MHQPTLDLVEKKIRSIFIDFNEVEILSQLKNYRTESYEREQNRVYLAILKLCEEDGLSKLEHYIKAAKQDYRDVLYWAECPNEAKLLNLSETDTNKISKIRKLDREQYEEWLNTI